MSDRSSEQEKGEQAMDQSDNLAHAFAGAGGGILSMALTYPLITLSTRGQVEKKKAKGGTYAAAKRIVDREGIVGLYAGMESALFGIAVTNFVYYYCMVVSNEKQIKDISTDQIILGYEFSRAFFQRTTKKSYLSTWESMAAGALAGSATCFITNPIWVVNTRMTTRSEDSDESSAEKGEAGEKVQSPTTIGTLMKIIKEDGVMRLFAGVLPALVLVANPILQYSVFEQLKQIIEKRRKIGATDSFVLGAIGKLVATTVTYPYITVKSRAHVAQGKQEGMVSSLKKIWSEEGFAGLFGGEWQGAAILH